VSTKQTERPKEVTERAKPDGLTRPAGKGHVGQRAQQHLTYAMEEGLLDNLPRFLLASDIAELLNISKSESYRVVAACGPVRIGNRKRLVRVSKVRFLRYLAQRQEAA
jgi:hypothetical protein